jgi:predicted RNase H-like nuclease
VDGCPAGWIAVKRGIGSGPSVAVHQGFGDILASTGNDAFIAVDMPIGLPDFVHRGGRGPEQAVRPLLGERQSSVFSIPSRAAVEATDYRDACRIALETSDPPRKVSKQAFHLFAKIREIDALLAPALQERVREVHPEMAFLELNGGVPMRLPKKIKGRFNPAGIAERRNLLARVGFSGDFLVGKPPRGAAYDDFIDACVCSVIAERIVLGIARSWPANPQRDSRGLHMAIWA